LGPQGITTTIREQARIRVCFRSPRQASTYLLTDTPVAGLSGLTAEFTQPGQFIGDAPGLPPVPGRGYDVDIPTAKAAVAATAGLRPDLDDLTRKAITRVAGQHYTNRHGATTTTITTAMSTTGAPSPGREWTEQDAAELAADIDRLAGAPDALGTPWPDLPKQPPAYRLRPEEALRLALRLLDQPDGTTPSEIERLTGRSQSWVHTRLAEWVDQGAVIRLAYGQYRSAATHHDHSE
jgi:hypothetical protein